MYPHYAIMLTFSQSEAITHCFCYSSIKTSLNIKKKVIWDKSSEFVSV